MFNKQDNFMQLATRNGLEVHKTYDGDFHEAVYR